MYRHPQVNDRVEVTNGNAVNFRKEGTIIATQFVEEHFEPNCTVRFADGTKHTYMGVELSRLNRDADEIAYAAKLEAMTEDELRVWMDREKKEL